MIRTKAMKNLIFLVLLTGVLFSGCAPSSKVVPNGVISKRKYNKGWLVQRVKHQSKQATTAEELSGPKHQSITPVTTIGSPPVKQERTEALSASTQLPSKAELGNTTTDEVASDVQRSVPVELLQPVSEEEIVMIEDDEPTFDGGIFAIIGVILTVAFMVLYIIWLTGALHFFYALGAAALSVLFCLLGMNSYYDSWASIGLTFVSVFIVVAIIQIVAQGRSLEDGSRR